MRSTHSTRCILSCSVFAIALLQGGCSTPPGRSNAQDDDFSKAMDALHRGEMTAAVDLLEISAASGDAEAQDELGRIYQYGVGIPQDYAQAAEWFRKAAEQGNVDAQVRLGSRYFNGEGVQQDYKQAAYWYSKAAGKSVMAAYNLGLMYEDGDGFPADDAKAQGIFRDLAPRMIKAAQDGNVYAQSSLGQMYYKGQGLPRDHSQAAFWYKKAAAQGDGAALTRLGEMLREGDGLPQDTPMAYVLESTGASIAGATQQEAISNRDNLRKSMTPAQLERSEDLMRQMQTNGIDGLFTN